MRSTSRNVDYAGGVNERAKLFGVVRPDAGTLQDRVRFEFCLELYDHVIVVQVLF